jgi:hypothetical protein
MEVYILLHLPVCSGLHGGLYSLTLNPSPKERDLEALVFSLSFGGVGEAAEVCDATGVS